MAEEISRGQVEFLGAITPEHVPQFLADTDIFVFTSHFEGCPNALLEAIMAGCVPVSWMIEGITDFILDEGETGFICPMGDCEAFAQAIATLIKDRERLQLMSRAAAETGRERFTHQRAASAYGELFKEVMAAAPPRWNPLPWSEFQGNPEFQHSWRDWVPGNIKQWIRSLT